MLIPGESSAQMRPLVREMLDNLRAIERISEGLALEDWDRIGDSARELRARAVSMRLLDLDTLRIERAMDPMWDAFLFAQEEAAREISTAVRKEDSRAVLQSTRKLLGNACLGCHAGFRDQQRGLRESVLFMTSFLSFWRDINRGLLVRDFGLVGAAETRDVAKILDHFDALWAEGCVSCHDRFRKRSASDRAGKVARCRLPSFRVHGLLAVHGPCRSARLLGPREASCT